MKHYEKTLKNCQKDLLRWEKNLQNNQTIYNEQRKLFLDQLNGLSYTQVELQMNSLNAMLRDKVHCQEMIRLLRDRIRIVTALIEGA